MAVELTPDWLLGEPWMYSLGHDAIIVNEWKFYVFLSCIRNKLFTLILSKLMFCNFISTGYLSSHKISPGSSRYCLIGTCEEVL